MAAFYDAPIIIASGTSERELHLRAALAARLTNEVRLNAGQANVIGRRVGADGDMVLQW